MKKIMTLLATLFLIAGDGNAQLYLEPVIGFQTDLANRYRFNQFNSAIQLGLKQSKYYELIFQVQVTWPGTVLSHDSSFSQNPVVPIYANAGKTLRSSGFSIAWGIRTPVLGRNSKDIFSLFGFGGLSYQYIRVTYQYDKSNYTILNPDKSQERAGVFFSGGIEYMRLLKNGRLFIQIGVASPPIGKAMNKPSSFSFMAPISLSAGYSIPIKRNINGK